MLKLRRFFLAALICCLLPVGAVGETAVASFYPIWLFANELVQGLDGVEVLNLAPPDTGCLHDYQLQTGDMRTLAKADAFLINGAGMESYMALVERVVPNLPVIDASAGIALLTADGNGTPAIGDAETEVNAHIWLDAGNAMQMVRNLSDGLCGLWPAHAEAISANRDAMLTRLAALDQELKEGLSGLRERRIITFHEAFPYFARAYGLEVAAVVNREPGEALSPSQLAELIGLIRTIGNVPLFVEPQYDDLAARTLAAETGSPIYMLDPIVTGPMDESAVGWYETAMLRNLEVLREALAD